MLDFVLNFLFPSVCGICGKLNENWLCNNCKKRIKKYENFELVKGKDKINRLFNFSNTIYFDEFLYCFEYKKLIRNLLLKYKFSDCAYLSNMFGNVILNNKKINEIFEKYDIMIPVPMDKIKKLRRGYNQTELITKYLEKNINFKVNFDSEIDIIKTIENKDYNNIVIDNKILIKNRNTKTQSTLKAEERIKNIENVFKVKDIEKIKNKRIILFDDIATTGSTVNEISRILKAAGASEILVLVIAKD